MDMDMSWVLGECARIDGFDGKDGMDACMGCDMGACDNTKLAMMYGEDSGKVGKAGVDGIDMVGKMLVLATVKDIAGGIDGVGTLMLVLVT